MYQLNIDSYYLAATRDLGLNLTEDGKKYINSIDGLVQGQYLQSGFIMLNCNKMLKDGLINKFRSFATKKLKYQDQDILNLSCSGKVLFLPLKYNMTDYSYYFINRKRNVLQNLYSEEEIVEAMRIGNIHFNGHKPWKKYSVNFDIWWEYYRKSPLFDESFYFNFFYSRLNEYDQLSLYKRIKILIRYFVYGKREL